MGADPLATSIATDVGGASFDMRRAARGTGFAVRSVKAAAVRASYDARGMAVDSM